MGTVLNLGESVKRLAALSNEVGALNEQCNLIDARLADLLKRTERPVERLNVAG